MKKDDDDDDGDITRTGRLHKRKFKRGPGIGERVPRIISLRREFHRGNEWEKRGGEGLWDGSRVDVTR